MNIEINGRSFDTPDNWNDLSLEQQLTIYGTLYSSTSDLLSPDALLPAKRISIMMFLCDIDEEFMKKWEDVRILEHGPDEGKRLFLLELHELCSVTDFLFDIIEKENEETGIPTKVYSVKLALTQNPYPLLLSKSDKKLKLYGPADQLKNVTIYELGITFTYFEEYIRTENLDMAMQLLSTLWRPGKRSTPKNRRQGYQGDRRLPYLKHETTIKRRIPVIKELPTAVCQLMLFWFASCRQHIIESHPDIFKRSDNDTEELQRADYGALLLEMAGGVVHLNAVAKQNYANVFKYLSKLEQERRQRVLNQKLNA